MMSREHAHNQTALLVLDVQRGVVATHANGTPEFLDRLTKAVEIARKADMLVIYVTVNFRAGYPEVSPHNHLFSRIVAGSPPAASLELHPSIVLKPSDVVVTKVRVSAFSGSDLSVILRAQGIHRLVLGGLITSGVVLSTVLEAADKDYELTVLSDGCIDPDPEIHRMLTTKIFPRYAEVLTLNEWEIKAGEGA